MSLSLFGYSQSNNYITLSITGDTAYISNRGRNLTANYPGSISDTVKYGQMVRVIDSLDPHNLFNYGTPTFICDTNSYHPGNLDRGLVSFNMVIDSFIVKDDIKDTLSTTISNKYTFVINFYIKNTTGINQISYNKINVNIFPNPTSGVVTISAPININKIAVENLVGQSVYTGTYNNTKILLNLSTIATGVYFIRINDIYIKKIVKE